MLKLIAEDYCQSCPMFEMAVEQARACEITPDGERAIAADTVVRCAHAGSCAAIADYLRKKIGDTCPLPAAKEEPKKEPEAVPVPEKQESKWAKWWERLRDRLCWIDVWDVLDAAFVVFAVAAAIFMLLLLVLFSVGIVRLLLGI